jgi:putative ABC transport system permease protein
VRNLLSTRRLDEDLDQEVRSYLAMLPDENVRTIMSPQEHDVPRASNWEVSQVKEQVREARLGLWLHSVLSDGRYGARQLRKNPGSTAIMVFTLALAIGATTAIFSVVYGVLLRPLPYTEPNRIMAVFEVNSGGTWSRLADPNFDDFRDQNHSFQAIAKYHANIASVSGASQPIRTTVASVSPDFFKVFGVRPIIGRDFSPDDNKKGAVPLVLVSYGYWKHYLGSSPDLSQSHLKIDNAIFSVIGVLPAGFQFPPDVSLWLPADLDGENPSRTSHNYYALGRLRDGVTVEQANGDIGAIAGRIHDTSSEQSDYLLKDGIVVPLQDSITGKARERLLVLLGAVGFLLLVACANVANLLLAQASVRERELAIRSALGAARGRLIRQFLTEAFLLSLVGGGLGVLGALLGVAGLVGLAPENLPRLDSVSISIPVLVFAFLLSTAVATGLGAFTAARATSGNPRKGLAEGGLGQTGSQSSQRIGQAIVAAQIAITFVLVVGAGLLGRSLMKVLEVNPGFRLGKIVAMDVSLPWVGWDPKAKGGQTIFFSNLIDRLKQIPGVRKVGATSGLPMDGGLPDGMFLLMMAYSVSRRTREIGVRVALGAGSRDVLTMILGQGLRTILIGAAIGFAGSLALTRTVKSLLFGVTATDPLTFAGVILLLVAAALLACYIPARRATRVDPMVALRYE